MDTLYLLLKFVHVLAVAVWIGGVVALVILNARLARAGDAAVSAALGMQSEYFGRSVLGPAMVITLLAGLGMTGVARFPFSTPWIAWGIVGLVLSIAVGVIAVGRAAGELSTLARSAAPDDPRLDGQRRRLVTLNALNLLLLASIVWAMVFKPTL
jgi:uncharacterized membrane protein